MLNQDRPKFRAIAIRNHGDSSVTKGTGRQLHIQRAAVILMGCLWIVAFSTGCSRNTKNCSAYDGVQFECAVEVTSQGAPNVSKH